MSAKVKVLSGPDRGREFRLGAGATRIGTDAGAQIRLNDQLLQNESLTVELQNGAYHITNGRTCSIYLSNRPLAAGSKGVWFDSCELQPTADTKLMLINDGRDAVDMPGKRFSIAPVWIVAAAGLAIGGMILLSPPESPRQQTMSPGQRRQAAIKTIQLIDELVDSKPAAWTQSRVKSLRDDLSNVLVREFRADYQAALAVYLRIESTADGLRQKLKEQDPNGDHAANDRLREVLELTDRIVNSGKIELSGKP